MKLRRLSIYSFSLVCLTTIPLVAHAQNVAGNQNLRKTLKDVDLVGSWIYDDLDAGMAEARDTAKPLLVVFRCVP